MVMTDASSADRPARESVWEKSRIVTVRQPGPASSGMDIGKTEMSTSGPLSHFRPVSPRVTMLKAVMKKRRIPPHKVKEFFTELIHEMYEKL